MELKGKDRLISHMYADFDEKREMGKPEEAFYYQYKREKDREYVQRILEDEGLKGIYAAGIDKLVKKLDNGELHSVDFPSYKNAMGTELKFRSKFEALALLAMAYNDYKVISAEQYVKMFFALKKGTLETVAKKASGKDELKRLTLSEWYKKLLKAEISHFEGDMNSYDDIASWLSCSHAQDDMERDFLLGSVNDYFLKNGMKILPVLDTTGKKEKIKGISGKHAKSGEHPEKGGKGNNENIDLMERFYEYQCMNLENSLTADKPSGNAQSDRPDWELWNRIYQEMKNDIKRTGCILPLFINPENGIMLCILGRNMAEHALFDDRRKEPDIKRCSCFFCIISFLENDVDTLEDYQEDIDADIVCAGADALVLKIYEVSDKKPDSKDEGIKNFMYSSRHVEVFNSLIEAKRRYELMLNSCENGLRDILEANGAAVPKSVKGTKYERYFQKRLMSEEERRLSKEYEKTENADLRRREITDETRKRALAAKQKASKAFCQK